MSPDHPDGLFHAIPTVLFKLGLRFPLHSFLVDIFEYMGCGFSQIVPNSHLILYAFIARCSEINVKPHVDMFFSIYRMNLLKSSKMYFFCARSGRVGLVTTPTSHPGWKSDFLFGRGPDLSVLKPWKVLPSSTLLSFNGRGVFDEEAIKFVNGDECFRHEDFHDPSFLRSHGLSGAKKQVVVGGGQAGSNVPSALAQAVLNRKRRNDAKDASPVKSTPRSQVNVHASSGVFVGDGDSSKVVEKEKGRLQGRVLKQPLEKSTVSDTSAKKTKFLPDGGPSLGCTISIGEREGWFVGPHRPFQIFEGFKFLNDADHFVARTVEEMEAETDLLTCRFMSCYAHLRQGFGHGLQSRLNDFKDKCASLEQDKGKLEKLVESLKIQEQTLGEQVRTAAEEKKKFNATISKLKDKYEERVKKLKDKVGSQNGKISDLKKHADDHDKELSSLKTQLEESKDLAAQSMEVGYKACLQKFIDDGVDISGKSWADYEKDLQAAFGSDGENQVEGEKDGGVDGDEDARDDRGGSEDGRADNEEGRAEAKNDRAEGHGDGDAEDNEDDGADIGSKLDGSGVAA